MITEYTDCTEFKRLIEDKKIKPAAVRRFLNKRGILFTSLNAETLAEDVYTIFLGGKEIEAITHLIVEEGNYEKSTLLKACYNNYEEKDKCDILDYFSDEISRIRSLVGIECIIEKPIKKNNELLVNVSYRKKRPGKNKLIEEEERRFHIAIRKLNETTASIDIRHPSSSDAQKAIELFKKISSCENSLISLQYYNINNLTDKNKTSFFDNLSSTTFEQWRLKTIVGITVRKSAIEDEEEIESQSMDDETESEDLLGVSQAVLHGYGLRSNSFVKNSLDNGYYISSITYRYVYNKKSNEFIIAISSKDDNLRIDINKTYVEEDGKLSIEPLPRDEQNEIITTFQTAINKVFMSLLEDQKEEAK